MKKPLYQLKTMRRMEVMYGMSAEELQHHCMNRFFRMHANGNFMSYNDFCEKHNYAMSTRWCAENRNICMLRHDVQSLSLDTKGKQHQVCLVPVMMLMHFIGIFFSAKYLRVCIWHAISTQVYLRRICLWKRLCIIVSRSTTLIGNVRNHSRMQRPAFSAVLGEARREHMWVAKNSLRILFYANRVIECKEDDGDNQSIRSTSTNGLSWKCRLCLVGKIVSKICRADMSATCRRHVGNHVGDMWSVVTLFRTTPSAMLACRRHVGVCPSQAANGVAHNLVISMKTANSMIAQDEGTMKPFISILQCNNLFAI